MIFFKIDPQILHQSITIEIGKKNYNENLILQLFFTHNLANILNILAPFISFLVRVHFIPFKFDSNIILVLKVLTHWQNNPYLDIVSLTIINFEMTLFLLFHLIVYQSGTLI